MTQPGIPLGHTIPAHRAFGWCSHCPDHTVAEELAAWQTREPIDVSPGPAAEIDRLRTANERMRHELEVMYGGAFDKLPEPAAVSAAVAPPTDRAAVLREVADELTRKANKLTERVHDLAYFVAKDRLREAEILDREATELRRMADETATRSDVGTEFARQADQPDEAGLAAWEGSLTDETATQTPFTPPAHYRRDDGVDCCVHAIPVGPDSCQACRELADEQPASGPTIVDQVVAALQAKAQALSVEAEEEMRRDLEEQAQVWHEAADLARRTSRKAARNAQPAAGQGQDGSQP